MHIFSGNKDKTPEAQKSKIPAPILSPKNSVWSTKEEEKALQLIPSTLLANSAEEEHEYQQLDTIAKLQEANSRLTHNNEQYQTEITTLNQQLKKQETIITQLKQQLASEQSNSRQQAQDHKRQTQSLNDQLNNTKKKLALNEKTLDQKIKENKQQHEDSNARIETLEEQLQKAQDELSTQTAQHTQQETLNTRISHLQQQAQKQQEELVRKAKIIQDQENTLKSQSEKLTQLKEKSRNRKEKHKESQRSLHDQIRTLTQQLETQQKQFEKKIAEIQANSSMIPSSNISSSSSTIATSSTCSSSSSSSSAATSSSSTSALSIEEIAESDYKHALYFDKQGIIPEKMYYLQLAAQHGHTVAQNNFAHYLEYNFDDAPEQMQQAMKEAIKWYKKAAEKNYAPAQNSLARCYYYAKGTEKDDKEALRLWGLAINQNYANAYLNLAIYYHELEDETEENNQKIIELLSKAANQDQDIHTKEKAQSLLNECRVEGIYKTPDETSVNNQPSRASNNSFNSNNGSRFVIRNACDAPFFVTLSSSSTSSSTASTSSSRSSSSSSSFASTSSAFSPPSSKKPALPASSHTLPFFTSSSSSSTASTSSPTPSFLDIQYGIALAQTTDTMGFKKDLNKAKTILENLVAQGYSHPTLQRNLAAVNTWLQPETTTSTSRSSAPSTIRRPS